MYAHVTASNAKIIADFDADKGVGVRKVWTDAGCRKKLLPEALVLDHKGQVRGNLQCPAGSVFTYGESTTQDDWDCVSASRSNPMCMKTTKEHTRSTLENMMLGMPELILPFTKKFRARCKVDGYPTVDKHAVVAVTGERFISDGERIPFPQGRPLLILHDPPGGGSFSSFTNVQATTSFATQGPFDGAPSSISTEASAKATINYGTKAKQKGETLALVVAAPMGAGAATGPVIELAEAGVKDEFSVGIGGHFSFEHEHKIQTLVSSASLSFTYSTAENPEKAGPASDVFLVPAVFFELRKVWSVRWYKHNPVPGDPDKAHCAELHGRMDNTLIARVDLSGFAFTSVNDAETRTQPVLLVEKREEDHLKGCDVHHDLVHCCKEEGASASPIQVLNAETNQRETRPVPMQIGCTATHLASYCKYKYNTDSMDHPGYASCIATFKLSCRDCGVDPEWRTIEGDSGKPSPKCQDLTAKQACAWPREWENAVPTSPSVTAASTLHEYCLKSTNNWDTSTEKKWIGNPSYQNAYACEETCPSGWIEFACTPEGDGTRLRCQKGCHRHCWAPPYPAVYQAERKPKSIKYLECIERVQSPGDAYDNWRMSLERNYRHHEKARNPSGDVKYNAPYPGAPHTSVPPLAKARPLAPEMLLKNAMNIDGTKTGDDVLGKWRAWNVIGFEGGGSSMEYEADDFGGVQCEKGHHCRAYAGTAKVETKSQTITSGPVLSFADNFRSGGTVFGVGVEGGVDVEAEDITSFTFVVMNTEVEQTEEPSQTFTLADDNIGDYFVVRLYKDPGRSRQSLSLSCVRW